mmetsp:Transcript_76331/g.134778  ORF Transcript_76331/g.134778 Transcript_76331/m.134778 type:complete len:155 (+) Transcript_76331:501-965(+)
MCAYIQGMGIFFGGGATSFQEEGYAIFWDGVWGGQGEGGHGRPCVQGACRYGVLNPHQHMCLVLSQLSQTRPSSCFTMWAPPAKEPNNFMASPNMPLLLLDLASSVISALFANSLASSSERDASEPMEVLIKSAKAASACSSMEVSPAPGDFPS